MSTKSELWTIRNGRNIPIRDQERKSRFHCGTIPHHPFLTLTLIDFARWSEARGVNPKQKRPTFMEAYEPFLAEHKIRFTNGTATQGAGSSDFFNMRL